MKCISTDKQNFQYNLLAAKYLRFNLIHNVLEKKSANVCGYVENQKEQH